MHCMWEVPRCVHPSTYMYWLQCKLQASLVGEWKSDGHMRELGRIVVLYGVPAFAKPWEEEGRKLGGFNLTKWLDLACTQVLGQY